MPIPEDRVVQLDAGLGYQAFVTIDKVSGEEVGGTRQERKTAARESAAKAACELMGASLLKHLKADARNSVHSINDILLLKSFCDNEKIRCDYQFDIIRAARNNRHCCQVSVGNLGVWTSNNRGGYATKQEAKESAAKNAVIGFGLKHSISATVEHPNLNLGLQKYSEIREFTVLAKRTTSAVRPNSATVAGANANTSVPSSVALTSEMAAAQISHPLVLPQNPEAANDPACLLAILQQQQKLIAQQQAWIAQQADALIDGRSNESATKRRRFEKDELSAQLDTLRTRSENAEAAVVDIQSTVVRMQGVSKELAVSLLFDKQRGILSFLKTTRESLSPKAKQLMLDFFVDLIRRQFGTSASANEMQSVCVMLFSHSKELAIVKKTAVFALISLVEAMLLDAPKVEAIAKHFVQAYIQGESKIVSSEFYARIAGRARQILSRLFLDKWQDGPSALKRRMMTAIATCIKSAEPDMDLLAGAVLGLSNYIHAMSITEAEASEVFATIRKMLIPLENQTRYAVPKAGMMFLQDHASKFHKQICSDRDAIMYLHICLKQMCKHTNKDISKLGHGAMAAFFQEVTIALSEQELENVQLELFWYFVKDFIAIVNSSDGSYKSLAQGVRGLGLFAKPCKVLLSENELKELLSILIKKLVSLAEGSNDAKYSHISAFLDAFKMITCEMTVIESDFMDAIEQVSVSALLNFPKIRSYYRDPMVTSFVQLLWQLNKHELLISFWSRVAKQLFVISCIVESPVNENADELASEAREPSWKDDLNLHVRENSGPGDDSPSSNIVSIASDTSKLVPESPSDFIVFVNFVSLSETILSKIRASLFLKWVFVVGQLVISYSSQHPLVSGFYKLFGSVLLLCEKLSFFGKTNERNAMVGWTITRVPESQLQDVDGPGSNANQLCQKLFSKYLSEVLLKIRQFKDDLLVSCLKMVLASPSELTSIANLCLPIVESLKMGLSYTPLAAVALDAMESWRTKTESKVMLKAYEKILPSFHDYLILDFEAEQGIAASNLTKTSAKRSFGRRKNLKDNLHLDEETVENLKGIQIRILKFLGSLGDANKLMLSSDTSDSLLAWDSERCLKFQIPFKETIVDIYFDDMLPRIVELAESSPDRKTKVAANELLHALVIIMVGGSQANRSGNELRSPYHKIYIKVFPVLLRLSVDLDKVTRELFRPLVSQLIHWFTKNSKYENPEAMALSQSCFDAVASTSGPLREFGAECIAEYLKWSIKHASEKELENNPMNAKSLFKRIYSLCQHSSASKRMSASIIVNRIYTVFRESAVLVDMFSFELLYYLLFSLKVADSDNAALDGSKLYREDYRSQIRSIFENVEHHYFKFSFIDALSKKTPRVTAEVFDEICAHSFQLILSNDYPADIRRNISHIMPTPALQSGDVENVIRFFVQNIKPIMEVLGGNTGPDTDESVKRYLTCKSICFSLMEIAYKRIPSSELRSSTGRVIKAFIGEGKIGEKEITVSLIKAAMDFKKKMPSESQELQSHRILANQSAYNATASCLLATQNITKVEIFNSYLFVEKPCLWENIIDTENKVFLKTDLDKPFIRMGIKEFSESAVLAGRTRKYISTQFLADSSLSQMGTLFQKREAPLPLSTSQKSLSSLSVGSQGEITGPPIGAENNGTLDNGRAEIELDIVNSNPCMKAMLLIISKLPAVTAGSEMPTWMKSLIAKIQKQETHINVKLFIGKLIINAPNIFETQKNQWWRFLMMLIADGDHFGEGINYFIQDLCMLLMEWNKDGALAEAHDQALILKSMRWLIRHCNHESKSVIRNHLKIIRIFVEQFKPFVIAPSDVLYDYLRIKPDPASKQQKYLNLSGIYALQTFLANEISAYDHRGLTDRVFSESDLYDAIRQLLGSAKTKEIYAPAAECLGALLGYLQKFNSPVLNEFQQKVDDTLKKLSAFDQKIYVIAVNRLSVGFPRILQTQHKLILNMFPKLDLMAKAKGLEAQLSYADSIPDLFIEMLGLDLNSILRSQEEECQVYTLGILAVISPTLTSSQVEKFLPLATEIFLSHTSERCRAAFFSMVHKISKNAIFEQLDHNLKVLVKHSLLKGISDPNGDRVCWIIFQMIFSRTQHAWYLPENEDSFLKCGVNFLMDACKLTPVYEQKIYDRALPDARFNDRNIVVDLSWSKNASMMPLFAATQDQLPGFSLQERSDFVRATQDMIWTPR
ncbi:NUC194 domain-containing protein [Chytriomyces cf. hyalinus JEL632]|nr:NUC194 domain-containing protein [Chytriomyces cf. hyalinus JEL632]